jgi:hypothetical protein
MIRKGADGSVYVPQEERRAFETKSSRVRASLRSADSFFPLLSLSPGPRL